MNPTIQHVRSLFLLAAIVATIVALTALAPHERQLVLKRTATPAAPVEVVPKPVTPKPLPKPLPRLTAFTASWCGPCRRAQPVVDEIEKEGLAQVTRVDIDEQADLVQKYEITAVPTFILYREGMEVLRTHDIEEVKASLETR
jgi:thioredoxin 1